MIVIEGEHARQKREHEKQMRSLGRILFTAAAGLATLVAVAYAFGVQV